MNTQSLPGFRDFYPEDCLIRNRIFAAWRATAEAYGFQPYDGPPLETLELYKKKSGDEIVGQLYHFVDKGEREVALRPEMTPTLARMICARGRSLKQPIKWYSIPQLFRYERQQKGRLREHFQFNCDIVGEAGVGADAELVALVIDSLCKLGLNAEDVVVKISDRQLLTAMLEHLGVGQQQMSVVLPVIDKITREPKPVIEKKLEEVLHDKRVAAAILELFEIKDLKKIQERFGDQPSITGRLLEVHRFFGMLEAKGLGNFVEFDLAIVRGLLYYTGLVYEVFDRKGEFRAVCGGGRYDQLLKVVGGVDMPATGFGMGDVVLTELLRARGKLPSLNDGLDVYVVMIDEALRVQAALPLARQLRQEGFSVEYDLGEAGVSKQFKQAGQRGARFAVVVGPEEWQRQSVKVKNMKTGDEQEVKADELKTHLKLVISKIG